MHILSISQVSEIQMVSKKPLLLSIDHILVRNRSMPEVQQPVLSFKTNLAFDKYFNLQYTKRSIRKMCF